MEGNHEMGSDTAVNQLIDRCTERLKKGWIKGWYWQDIEGKNIYPGDGEPVCFCSVGAVLFDEDKDAGSELLERLRANTPQANIAAFNDSQNSVEPIIELFEKCRDVASN
jgi:hypothetical protein